MPQLSGDEAALLLAGASLTEAAPLAAAGTASVSCILAAGVPGRRHLVAAATRRFLAQSWPAKELVVVNATGRPILTEPVDGVREIAVRPGSIGALRNCGIAQAAGDFVLAWDDDDGHAPGLIAALAGAVQPGRAAALTTQLRIDLEGRAVAVERPGGLACALLTPRRATRYREGLPFGEDQALFDAWRGRCDPVAGGAALRVAIYHGGNAAPRSLFFPADARPADAAMLAEAAAALADLGLMVTASAPSA